MWVVSDPASLRAPRLEDGAGVPFHPLAPPVGTSPAAVAVEAPEEELVTVLLEGSAPPICLRRVCSSDVNNLPRLRSEDTLCAG